MNNNQKLEKELPANDGALALNIISWLFGALFFSIGIVNTFWGGDTPFGIFIVLLSLVYFLPVNDILDRMIGLRISRLWIVKILLGMFIIWAAMGVGELFDKIEMMVLDLK